MNEHDMVRCLLDESSLSKNFSGAALMTAVFLRNRCPTKSLDDITPAAIWNNEKSKASILKVFGCECFAVYKDKNQQRKKLDSRSRKCVFFVYHENYKAYKLWDLENQKIIISSGVIFNNNKFPFKTFSKDKSDNFVTVKEKNKEKDVVTLTNNFGFKTVDKIH